MVTTTTDLSTASAASRVRTTNNNARFFVVLAILLAGGIAVNLWQSGGDAKIARQPLKTLPAQIGSWQQVGADERFDKVSETILGASDYLLRNYRNTDGNIASFYAGYYNTQRTGATYHSPLNCLPGSGWVLTPLERTEVKPKNGDAPFLANRYLIANGTTKQLMLYWYMGRGRNTASEYRDKINTVLDSITRRRSDGAMVRVLVPIAPAQDDSQAADKALRVALDLAENATPALAAHVPK